MIVTFWLIWWISSCSTSASFASSFQLVIWLCPSFRLKWFADDPTCSIVPCVKTKILRATSSQNTLGKESECLSAPPEKVFVNFWSERSREALNSPSFCLSPFRYKRIFSVGTLGITTYNPQSLEITNQVKNLHSQLATCCESFTVRFLPLLRSGLTPNSSTSNRTWSLSTSSSFAWKGERRKRITCASRPTTDRISSHKPW